MMLRHLLALAMLLILSPLALADGLIVIHNPPDTIPGHFPFAPLQVAYHRVSVTIEDNIATTTVDQEFRNPSSARLEGTYLFPLPENAHIDRFAMDVNGKLQDAELLSAEKARAIYEEIVRKQRDPALLEYVGRGAFKARVFPIEPNSTKQIKIRYTQLLKSDGGLTEYVYPLNTEKFSSTPLADVSVKVELKTSDPLKSVYCPSHAVDVHRNGSNAATVGYEQKDVRPDTDFRLVFAQDAQPLDLRMLSSAKAGEDGYFLLMVSPGMQAEGKQVQTRDVCFVVDTSGSMAGAKIEQAKRALRYCVNSLNAGDRFQVVRFSTDAEPLWEQVTAVSPESTRKAMEFIDSFKAVGGTDIHDALDKAMKIRTARKDSSRPYVVVFLTDGQPTIGETNEDKLVAAAGGSEQTRIFSFGIGEDINTHLLDRLAEKTGAFSTYVGSREDLEVKVSNFFAGIQAPVLTDVRIALTGDGVRAYDLMPRTMPDLYRGQTLYVVGRYHGSGSAAVSLSGSLNGEAKRFSQDVKLASEDNSRPYVAQLYATRRVGWLLDEIRLHGESAELRDEVTRLAREFGIVTPYTSYLIVEDERRRNVPAESQTMRELSRDRETLSKAEYFYSSSGRDSARLEKSGAQAVTNSQSVNAMKEANAPGMGGGRGMMGAVAMPSAAADALSKPATSPSQGYRNATNYAQQVRVVSGRAFYQNGNTWTDATAQGQQNLRQQTVKFGSDAYFALANRSKSVATWLALGNEVDVVVDGTLYQVRN